MIIHTVIMCDTEGMGKENATYDIWSMNDNDERRIRQIKGSRYFIETRFCGID